MRDSYHKCCNVVGLMLEWYVPSLPPNCYACEKVLMTKMLTVESADWNNCYGRLQNRSTAIAAYSCMSAAKYWMTVYQGKEHYEWVMTARENDN